MDTTSTRNIQIALKVLARQYDVKTQLPTPEEIETLKALFRERAGNMTLHEIARTVLESELTEEGRAPNTPTVMHAATSAAVCLRVIP